MVPDFPKNAPEKSLFAPLSVSKYGNSLPKVDFLRKMCYTVFNGNGIEREDI